MYMNVYECVWMYMDVKYMNVDVHTYMNVYIWCVYVCIYPCINTINMNIKCVYSYDCIYLWMNINV